MSFNIEIYLIIMNLLGFILFGLIIWLDKIESSIELDKVLTVCSIAGGSLGAVIGITLLQRDADKRNMMSRVFVFSTLIIQIIIYLFYKGYFVTNVSLNIFDYLKNNTIFTIYLIIINIVTFITFAIDKFAAINNRWRISIVTLLILCFMGGALGGLISMHVFRHKIRKDYFSIGLPLIIFMQIVILIFLNSI